MDLIFFLYNKKLHQNSKNYSVKFKALCYSKDQTRGSQWALTVLKWITYISDQKYVIFNRRVHRKYKEKIAISFQEIPLTFYYPPKKYGSIFSLRRSYHFNYFFWETTYLMMSICTEWKYFPTKKHQKLMNIIFLVRQVTLFFIGYLNMLSLL